MGHIMGPGRHPTRAAPATAPRVLVLAALCLMATWRVGSSIEVIPLPPEEFGTYTGSNFFSDDLSARTPDENRVPALHFRLTNVRGGVTTVYVRYLAPHETAATALANSSNADVTRTVTWATQEAGDSGFPVDMQLQAISITVLTEPDQEYKIGIESPLHPWAAAAIPIGLGVALTLICLALFACTNPKPRRDPGLLRYRSMLYHRCGFVIVWVGLVMVALLVGFRLYPVLAVGVLTALGGCITVGSRVVEVDTTKRHLKVTRYHCCICPLFRQTIPLSNVAGFSYADGRACCQQRSYLQVDIDNRGGAAAGGTRVSGTLSLIPAAATALEDPAHDLTQALRRWREQFAQPDAGPHPGSTGTGGGVQMMPRAGATSSRMAGSGSTGVYRPTVGGAVPYGAAPAPAAAPTTTASTAPYKPATASAVPYTPAAVAVPYTSAPTVPYAAAAAPTVPYTATGSELPPADTSIQL